MSKDIGPTILFAGTAVMDGYTVQRRQALLTLSKQDRNKYASLWCERHVCLTDIDRAVDPLAMLCVEEEIINALLREGLRQKTKVAVSRLYEDSKRKAFPTPEAFRREYEGDPIPDGAAQGEGGKPY